MKLPFSEMGKTGRSRCEKRSRFWWGVGGVKSSVLDVLSLGWYVKQPGGCKTMDGSRLETYIWESSAYT